jgi:hypothetical protein
MAKVRDGQMDPDDVDYRGKIYLGQKTMKSNINAIKKCNKLGTMTKINQRKNG